jgi:hypothetical protein
MNREEYSKFCSVVTMLAAEYARVTGVQVTSQLLSPRKPIIMMMAVPDGAPGWARAKAWGHCDALGGSQGLRLL